MRETLRVRSHPGTQGHVILEGRQMMEAFCGVWAAQSSFAFTVDFREMPVPDQSTGLRVPDPPARGAPGYWLDQGV